MSSRAPVSSCLIFGVITAGATGCGRGVTRAVFIGLLTTSIVAFLSIGTWCQDSYNATICPPLVTWCYLVLLGVTWCCLCFTCFAIWCSPRLLLSRQSTQSPVVLAWCVVGIWLSTSNSHKSWMLYHFRAVVFDKLLNSLYVIYIVSHVSHQICNSRSFGQIRVSVCRTNLGFVDFLC